jgi:hypothetical protein
MPNKKTLIVAQLLITLMMAFSMSGIMSLIALGPTLFWFHTWMQTFIMAWPIAFCLSIPVGKIAFALSGKLTASRQPEAAAA